VLVALRDAGKPLPAGAVCISPWMDLALTGASIQGKSRVDCTLDSESLEMYARYYYAGEYVRTSPLISPLYADLSDLPPLLIQVGTDEILLDDATRCADKARQAGVDVTLEIWDEMFHVFQLIPFLPEAKQAVGHIAEFQIKEDQRLCHPACRGQPEDDPGAHPAPHGAKTARVPGGYNEQLFGTQHVVEYEEETRSHAALTYDNAGAVGTWAKSVLPARQALRQPEPLFKKLDESVIEEEYARLG
jgi:hypothetical protein